MLRVVFIKSLLLNQKSFILITNKNKNLLHYVLAFHSIQVFIWVKKSLFLILKLIKKKLFKNKPLLILLSK